MRLGSFVALVWCVGLAVPAIAGQSSGSPETITIGSQQVRLGIDFAFAGVSDDSQRATIGRERQMKVPYANVSLATDVGDHITFRVVINPADDSIVPRPYVPTAADRRTYFFPNVPEGRGVSSDPNGIKDVDDYKTSHLDPIIQQGMLRLGYVDLHDKTRTMGVSIGRVFVPQGFALDELTWFTAKDLTHIQRINAQADNGATFYYNQPRYRVDLSIVSGNGNPYHDYGYYDFTDASEDKNSAVGAVLSARYRTPMLMVGGSYRKNFINSRVEDSASLQLSKHNDNAIVGFASVKPHKYVRAYGEVVRYTWGLTESSAALLSGPANESPVQKPGYYVGVDVVGPETRYGAWGLTLTREELSRDDALVAWAAANNLYGVTLGKKERSTILKVQARVRQLTFFAFKTMLSNPFPELSALVPVTGTGTSTERFGDDKTGFGVRLRF